ncbi:MAG TPA: serine/threonine-protein kinase [Polyangiaceae bacterium]|nr:serine/threonine-protein kinase [Polyangiaceae bacterium]
MEPKERTPESRVNETFARKWHIDRLLEVGGMAAVYAATHRNGNRVAIKVLRSILVDNGELNQRFLEEGYVANRVGHPGAVKVLDDDVLEDGTPFIVMELLEGESLEGRLKRETRVPPEHAVYIAERVLDVLGAAHDKGIIHRDIKPGNVFLTSDGSVKVLDFGLARVRERTLQGRGTRPGMIVGTVSYMPPEQARGKRDLIDARTDIWAVGATMFRALSGRCVHEGDSLNERLVAAMSRAAPKFSDIVPSTEPTLAAIIDRALTFQREERWADTARMQKALREAYRKLTGNPYPVATTTSVLPASQPSANSASRPADESVLDVPVSVVLESGAGREEIVVDVEDSSGNKDRYEVRPVEGADATIELSYVSIVESEDS